MPASLNPRHQTVTGSFGTGVLAASSCLARWLSVFSTTRCISLTYGRRPTPVRLLGVPLRPLVGLQSLDRGVGQFAVDGEVELRSDDGDPLRDRPEIVAEG